jgi:hypothetical protein
MEHVASQWYWATWLRRKCLEEKKCSQTLLSFYGVFMLVVVWCPSVSLAPLMIRGHYVNYGYLQWLQLFRNIALFRVGFVGSPGWYKPDCDETKCQTV